MGRKNAVDVHPAREYIKLELAKGTSYRHIAAQFSGTISPSALGRYKRLHLPKDLAKAQDAKETSNADKLMAELSRIRAYANKMLDACDRELTDPDHPERYDIGPRDHDVSVTYTAIDEHGKPYRRKARMSDLLKLLEKRGILPAEVRWRISDPRDLILKTHKALKEDIELLGRIWGEIKGEVSVGISVTDPVFIQIQNVILEATKDAPETRQRIVYALNELGKED